MQSPQGTPWNCARYTDIRDAKKDGLIDQFFYGSMSAEYLMDQIYAM